MSTAKEIKIEAGIQRLEELAEEVRKLEERYEEYKRLKFIHDYQLAIGENKNERSSIRGW